jgi:Lon protease-like protein
MNDDLANFDGPIPLFPLPNAVLFPQIVLPFHIFEPRYRKMVEDTLEDRHLVGLSLLQPGWEEESQGRPPIHPVGCVGRIGDLSKLPDGRFNLSLFGLRRFRITEEIPSDPYRRALVDWLPEASGDAAPEEERRVIEQAVRLLNAVPMLREDELINPEAFPGGEQFARSVHSLAIRSRLFPVELQRLPELDGPFARAEALARTLAVRVASRRSAERSQKFAPEDPGVN